MFQTLCNTFVLLICFKLTHGAGQYAHEQISVAKATTNNTAAVEIPDTDSVDEEEMIPRRPSFQTQLERDTDSFYASFHDNINLDTRYRRDMHKKITF